MMKTLRNIGASAVLGLGAATQAMAEPPAEVKTAITGAGADASVIGGLVLVVLVGIMAFKYMRKAM